MLDALTAEALKMRRHRGTWLMVWIYPIVILFVLAGSLIYHAVAGSGPSEAASGADQWIRDTTLLWHAPDSGPARILIAGFAALLFAGEFNWNTWKLIVPARERWQLIAAKWAVGVGFVFLALFVTSLIIVAGEFLRSLQGAAIPSGVRAGALLEAHARAGAYALLPISYAVAFAGLFALVTRSVLATVILSIVLTFVESLLGILGPFFYQYAPNLTHLLIEFLPPYHVSNMASWAFEGRGMNLMLGADAAISLSWATSLWALLAWIAAACVTSMLVFLRADLN